MRMIFYVSCSKSNFLILVDINRILKYLCKFILIYRFSINFHLKTKCIQCISQYDFYNFAYVIMFQQNAIENIYRSVDTVYGFVFDHRKKSSM